MFHVEQFYLDGLQVSRYGTLYPIIYERTIMSNPLPPKRGLGALLQNTSRGIAPTVAPNTPPSIVPVLALRPNPNQPRKVFKEDALVELTDSIKAKGIIQPIIVRPLQPKEIQGDTRYEIIAGERRFRAAQRAGLTQVPIHIINVAEASEVLVLSLIENIQRNDLNPIEECQAFLYLKNTHHITQDELAKATGKSRASIANIMRLQELPESLTELVASGQLSLGLAKLIVGIPDDKLKTQVASKAVAEGWTVRQLESYLLKSPTNSPKLPLKSTKVEEVGPDPYLAEMQATLREHFGTKVEVTESAKKGRIMIEFYSVQDFDRIVSQMGVKRSS